MNKPYLVWSCAYCTAFNNPENDKCGKCSKPKKVLKLL